MPFFSSEALRELRANSEAATFWWKAVHGLVQTVVVLWLVTRFIDTNLFAHVGLCLAVIVVAELRLNHLRSTYHVETFGLVSWQALRALHERLDTIHPPTHEKELSDRNADIHAVPLEPVKPVYWKDRIAVPIDRSPLHAPSGLPRHWGTKLLHRELGNVQLARVRAGWSYVTGVPEVGIYTSNIAAFAYSTFAKIAIVWAIVMDCASLPTLWLPAAAFVVLGLTLITVVEIAQGLPERRLHKEALNTARERGIETALAKMSDAGPESTWEIRKASAPESEKVIVCFEGRVVEIYHHERFVFRGFVSSNGARLCSITFFDDGDWPVLLRNGKAQRV